MNLKGRPVYCGNCFGAGWAVRQVPLGPLLKDIPRLGRYQTHCFAAVIGGLK